AQVAHLEDFLRFEQPTFDSASSRLSQVIEKRGRLTWFSAFYGEPVGQIIVSPLLISGAGNFAAEFVSGDTHERDAFVSFQVSDRAGFPVPPADAIEQIVHELSHSFVNHVVVADSMRLRESGERIFAVTKPSMEAMAYTKWLTMCYESLVRAAVIR